MAQITYFKGRGRAETTRWMLAISQIDFTHVVVETKDDLAALRASGKLPFDQMPLLEIDDLCLSQSSAMIRYLARKGGYYGDTDTHAWQCDLVAGTVADFAETGLKAAFQASEKEALAGLQTCFNKFSPHFEAHLAKNPAAVSAGERLSFADVVLAEALSNYLEWCPDILDGTPLMQGLYERVIKQPGVARYLASGLRYPKPDDTYIIDVARVLERALPAHMDDPDRFVRKP